MSLYPLSPLSLADLQTVPLTDRGGKVDTTHFARPHQPGAGLDAWLSTLPKLLAAAELRALADLIVCARSRRPIIWALGGHVIKCGLAPVLIDLMRRGYATAFALNGSAAIHDLEIALVGATSEDVEAVLPDGRFGIADETGLAIAAAARLAQDQQGDQGIGFGEALGQHLDAHADPRYADLSLLVQAYRARVPVTVHVAIGTDTPHIHPALDPAALGLATHHDFRLFCALVADLHAGGVHLNVGSAVVLPEVFLKAVSLVRNLGQPLTSFTTANLDFLQHYRPRVNVVQRPHAGAGGRGIQLTGHHEIMLPLLAALLIEHAP